MLRFLAIILGLSLATSPLPARASKACVPGDFLTLKAGKKTWNVSEERLYILAKNNIVTSTHWSKSGRYSGPLLSDVIKIAALPEKPKKLTVYTWDNYRASLPYSDMKKYGVILATSLDGKRLKLSDWGPLYIIYPYDEYMELKTPAGLMKMIWQVCRIELE